MAAYFFQFLKNVLGSWWKSNLIMPCVIGTPALSDAARRRECVIRNEKAGRVDPLVKAMSVVRARKLADKRGAGPALLSQASPAPH